MTPRSILNTFLKRRQSTQSSEDQSSDDEHFPNRLPSPRNMIRTLGAAATRTIHMAHFTSRRLEAPAMVQCIVSHPDAHNQVDHDHLANPAGPEASFLYSHLPTLPIDVGAITHAGWHLIPDLTGSGQPVRARKPNQDSFDVQAPVPGDGLYTSVFDGHGSHGRQVSQFVRNIIPKLIRDNLLSYAQRPVTPGGEQKRRNFARAFSRAFHDAERYMHNDEYGIDHAFSGTTATCCWLDGCDLFCAWVGDSRCVLARRTDMTQANDSNSGSSRIIAVNLSSDQKPARKDERSRVRAAGGRVTRWQPGSGPQRVWLPEEWLPGLAMTRSIGDTILSRYGVLPHPEITVTKIGSLEEFYVVASDGVWEFMGSDQVVDFVWALKQKGVSAEEAARKLVEEAVKHWTEREMVVDDTTAIVVYLDVGIGRKECIFRENVQVNKSKSLSARLRGNNVESGEVGAGEPWRVLGNGRLQAFMADSRSADDAGITEDGNTNE